MLTVTKIDENEFMAKFKYSDTYFERLSQSDYAEYSKEDRCFYIPMNRYLDFKADFHGEYIFKTNKVEFPGEVEDKDYMTKYKLQRDYKLPILKVNPYKYQSYGMNFMLNKLRERKYVLNCDSVGLGM